MKLQKGGKKSILEDKVVPIRWKEINGNKVIVTNDFGNYVILKKSDFKLYVENKISRQHKMYKELEEKGFIKTYLDFDFLFRRWKTLNSYLFTGPSLHILVVTLRCNHKCLYCQSQAIGPLAKNTDMSFEIARKSINIAFKSSSNDIIIEFQGGEPLYNWDVIKKSIKYIREKEKSSNKKVFISLVTNFSLMDERKASFLLENEVSLCTSLDGPKELHDLNRIYTGADSYGLTVKWIKYFNKKHETQYGLPYRIFKPSALLTVSRYSLRYPKEIVDEYVKHNLENIFIRPLSPIGYAKKFWDKIGYTPQEFINFYKTILSYIIELNLKGKVIYERMAQIILNKVINGKDTGFTDLRCPCGAGVGQIAYNFNGDIYTCDEGRMIGWMGNDFFKIGNVNDSYEDIINSPITRLCAYVSNLEVQPKCSRCPYMPWCGVCPVVNYETQDNVWGNNFNSYRCAIMTGLFETVVLDFMQNKKYSKVLERWI